MDSLQCGFAADTRFGPSVSPCRRQFDFTIFFEETVLAILPSCCFIILAIGSLILSLRARPLTRVRRGWLYWAKLISAIVLVLVQIAVLVVQARLTMKTSASIPSCVASLVATIFIPAVSHFDHLRCIRPSTLLVSFLTLTSIFDVTRTRTYWLSGELEFAFTVSLSQTGRLIVLFFESMNKKHLLLPHDEKIPAENLAGPISRTVFHWLNGLLRSGYRGVLYPEDLGPVDDRLLTARLRGKFETLSRKYESHGTNSKTDKTRITRIRLIWLTLKAVGRAWAGPVIARLAVTAFTFTQPFLANAALEYLQADYAIPKSHGYGLIGAAFLCYGGIAAATSRYWHEAYRCAVMVRGGLSIVIFEKVLKLPEGDKVESVATTLMVDDLQRVMTATARGHEVWAGMIEIGLATWLLYIQLGPCCFVMLGVSAAAGLGSMYIMKKAGSHQQRWLAATQTRLKRTKRILDSLKGIKMSSQDSKALRSLKELREKEIKESSSFRWIMLVTVFLSYCPLILSPPLIFGVYVGTASSGYDFNVSKVFTSLIIITLLSAPLVRLFQTLPQLGGAYGCFQRLHGFLSLTEQTYYREEEVLAEKSGAESHDRVAEQAHVISLKDLALSWNTESEALLMNIYLRVRKGDKIAIIGPVGTGKTLLLKGLIGEAYRVHGQLTMAPSTSLAYCSQTAWLENVSVEQNMLQYGKKPKGSEFYNKMAADCLLDDLIQLPTFTSESIGSGGVKLSGGQRQRLALARALSTESDILVLDDVFSALDRRTRWHIATALLKKSSGNSDRTVIYTTHDEQIANLADEVYQIDETGHLFKRTDLGVDSASTIKVQSPTFSDTTNVDDGPSPTRSSPNRSESTPAVAKTHDAADRQAAKQRVGDMAVYKTYFKSVGLSHTTIFFIGAMAWSVSFKFSDVWIQWWSDAPDSGDKHLGYWLGIYAGLGAMALMVLSVWMYHQQFNVITRSGKRLHDELATTILKAQFPVISQIDTGTTLNRFSQDLMFVDMQLPVDLLNTSDTLITGIIQIVLIAVASKPALCAVPVVLIVLYMVQHFYLRTSKQLRLQELEAKAALVTKIAETSSGAGLSTIRAHGWSDITRTKFLEKLDRSQEPLYLLYAIQRWLQLVLNLVVAGIVVVVLGACIALKSSNKVSAGAAGVAFLNAVTLGETLTQFILAWTGLETSLGAIARIALFQHETPVEEDNPTVPMNAPGAGGIKFENVWATYNADATSTSSEAKAKAPLSKGSDWSLRGITLDIKPGERIAICGKTGSGKSTMHLALLRMVNIPIGSIFIDGVEHTHISLETLRKHFLVVSQDKLASFGTIREELDPGHNHNNESIEEVLRLCGTGLLDKILSVRGGLGAKRDDVNFSAGEEQLLSVARVMLKVELLDCLEKYDDQRPSTSVKEGGIVLLDEITSSIDTKTEEKMELLLKTRLGGRTLIAINHRLEAVLDYDRVVVLDNGMIADIGTPEEMLERCELFAGLKTGHVTDIKGH